MTPVPKSPVSSHGSLPSACCWGEGPLLLLECSHQGGHITCGSAQLGQAGLLKSDLTQGLGTAGGMRCRGHHCYWLTCLLVAHKQGSPLPRGVPTGLPLPDPPSESKVISSFSQSILRSLQTPPCLDSWIPPQASLWSRVSC